MKIAIVGAGLIGCERISAVQKISKQDNSILLLGVFDIDQNRLDSVKNKYNIATFNNIENIFNLI